MVSQRVSSVIWALGGGRCSYCNKLLIGDLESGNEDGKFGFIAHIVAEEPGGPRGDPTRSPLLANDVKNLMLMCATHHKLIDVDDPDNYSEERLLKIKADHEDRIRILTAIKADRATHVVRYGAKIGEKDSSVSYDRLRTAVLPERYPAGGTSIAIEIRGNVATDGEDAYWATEPDNLRRRFQTSIADRITAREIDHMSIFALAPIPLLIELGRLLGDITPADVYQLHREPAGWHWAESGPHIEFDVRRPAAAGKQVALKFGISGIISDDRIMSVLGPDVAIWSLNAKRPGNDVMRYRTDLAEFRRLMRSLYNEIKAAHGEHAEIHAFPAVPVSVAVEIGRVRMPKADLPIIVYDNTPSMGFKRRLTIAG